MPEQNQGSVGKDLGWWNGCWIGNHCPPESFPSSESEWAHPVTTQHSKCRVWCVCSRAWFPVDWVPTKYFSLLTISSLRGSDMLYSYLKAPHPAQLLSYPELSKDLWGQIYIYWNTTQFTSSFLIYSFRDYTCCSGLQLELEGKFISMNGEVSEQAGMWQLKHGYRLTRIMSKQNNYQRL